MWGACSSCPTKADGSPDRKTKGAAAWPPPFSYALPRPGLGRIFLPGDTMRRLLVRISLALLLALTAFAPARAESPWTPAELAGRPDEPHPGHDVL